MAEDQKYRLAFKTEKCVPWEEGRKVDFCLVSPLRCCPFHPCTVVSPPKAELQYQLPSTFSHFCNSRFLTAVAELSLFLVTDLFRATRSTIM